MKSPIPVLLGALLACAAPPDGNDGSADVGPELVGPTWTLVEIQSMDDSVDRPGASEPYTLRFLEGGGLEVVAHCNHGRGTWEREAASGLRFGPIAATRAYCGDDSMDSRFLRELSYVRSYVLREGRLYLATMADGAILQFEAAP